MVINHQSPFYFLAQMFLLKRLDFVEHSTRSGIAKLEALIGLTSFGGRKWKDERQGFLRPHDRSSILLYDRRHDHSYLTERTPCSSVRMSSPPLIRAPLNTL